MLKPDQSIELWKDLFLRLMITTFLRLRHVQPKLDILIGKLAA